MSTTMMRANVTNGPGAADIVNSFLYAYSPTKLPVHFTVEIMVPGGRYEPSEFDAVIKSIRYESGSHGMFIIEFHITSHTGWGDCEGFYDAHRRHGWFNMSIL